MGGVEVGDGMDEESKAGSSIHLTRQIAIMCSLKCTNRLSSLVRHMVAFSSLTPIVAY